MSESKARMQNEIRRLEKDLTRVTGNCVFLLQTLLDIGREHPDIELPDLGQGRFSEVDWMAVTI